MRIDIIYILLCILVCTLCGIICLLLCGIICLLDFWGTDRFFFFFFFFFFFRLYHTVMEGNTLPLWILVSHNQSTEPCMHFTNNQTTDWLLLLVVY